MLRKLEYDAGTLKRLLDFDEKFPTVAVVVVVVVFVAAIIIVSVKTRKETRILCNKYIHENF